MNSIEWGKKGGSLLLDVVVGNPEVGQESVGGVLPEKLSSLFPWFALRVKSNFERVTAIHLRQRGYHEFLPMSSCRTRWSDRVKNVKKPLFPGYVFCSFDSQHRLPVLTTPGVLHIVGNGREPIAIDQAEIDAICALMKSGVPVTSRPYLQIGERVEVARGPLAGIAGIVTQLKGQYRLILSISLLQRSISAEIERDWIGIDLRY